MTQSFDPKILIAATAGLLAFLVGLYTLVGRERKSPYIINSIFILFAICLSGSFFDLLSMVVPEKYYKIKLLSIYIGVLLLITAILYSIYSIVRLYFRFAYFIDSVHPKHFSIFRCAKEIIRTIRPGKIYEHNADVIDVEQKESIKSAIYKYFPKSVQEEREDIEDRSLAISCMHQGQANILLFELCRIFLEKGHPVQYMTCSRHPYEFIFYMKEKLSDKTNEWNKFSGNIVVIDAYTPHFGFLDSVYSNRTREIKTEGVKYICSGASFPGMHSASAKAFNLLKKRSGGNQRLPALVIYEDAYAIADLESVEQYRVFIRHVLPSERLWDGMFTVFIESAQQPIDWGLLSSYTALVLNLRSESDAETPKDD